MFSKPTVRSLSLAGGDLLQVEWMDSNGQILVNKLSLDNKLGNYEGSFDINGAYFSRSARNIGLVNDILYATLLSSGGVWWDDQLAIDVEIRQKANGPAQINIQFRRCDFMRLKGSRNLRLINGFLLAAEYLGTNLSYQESYLDLDSCLGNENGSFKRDGRGFSKSAKNIALFGTTLHADLSAPQGRHVRASIELSSILRFTDSGIRPLKNLESKDWDLEVIRDKSNKTRRWLPNTWDVRILNYRHKRLWYLVADCQTPNGGIQESVFRLSNIIRPHVDEIFGQPFFLRVDVPDQAREVTLENGILTASFILKKDKDTTEWTKRSIDLEDIVTNKGGDLTLKRSGSNCLGCGDLFYANAFYTPYRGRRVPLNCEEVEARARSCTLCRLLHNTISAFKPLDGPHEAWLETAPSPEIYDRQPRRVELVVRAHDKPKKRSVFRRHLHHKLIKDEPRSEEVRCTIQFETEEHGTGADTADVVRKTFRTIPRSTATPCWLQPDLRWSTVQNWITTCAREHKGCRSMDAAELPTRYLDIGCRGNDRIRLVTSSVGERGSYACLSHCWGGKSVCTLTTKTSLRFSKMILPRLLPPVFNDAIAICRKLGLQRIWIDSLCIQQDSKEDWMREAPRMGQYYSNCIICIAATSSADSNSGMEIEPRPSAVRSSGTAGFNLIAYPTHLLQYKLHFSHVYDPQPLFTPFPLLTRAWVLQERFLAPRTLHFCHDEVVFECDESLVCECGATAKNIWDVVRRPISSIIRGTSSSLDGLICRRKPLEHLSWVDLVSTYSFLGLTRETDRLVAISGMASMMGTVHGWDIKTRGIYLAGLWRPNLERQLSWYVGDVFLSVKSGFSRIDVNGGLIERKPRPAQYLAPSWSWASVLDPVQYIWENDSKYLFDVLDARINLATDDEPFGGVKEGCYLRLRGKALASSWKIQPGKKSGPQPDPDLFILTDVVGTQSLDHDDTQGVVFSPDYAVDAEGASQVSPSTKLLLFPLATHKISLRSYGGYREEMNKLRDLLQIARTTICLVLRAVSSGLSGVEHAESLYERVGFVEYANYKNGIRNIDPNVFESKEIFLI